MSIVRIRKKSDGRIEIGGFLWEPHVLKDMADKLDADDVRGFDLVELSPGCIEVCPIKTRATA